MIINMHEDEPIRVRDRLERYRVFREEVRVDSPGSGERFADPVVNCGEGQRRDEVMRKGYGEVRLGEVLRERRVEGIKQTYSD